MASSQISPPPAAPAPPSSAAMTSPSSVASRSPSSSTGGLSVKERIRLMNLDAGIGSITSGSSLGASPGSASNAASNSSPAAAGAAASVPHWKRSGGVRRQPQQQQPQPQQTVSEEQEQGGDHSGGHEILTTNDNDNENDSNANVPSPLSCDNGNDHHHDLTDDDNDGTTTATGSVGTHGTRGGGKRLFVASDSSWIGRSVASSGQQQQQQQQQQERNDQDQDKNQSATGASANIPTSIRVQELRVPTKQQQQQQQMVDVVVPINNDDDDNNNACTDKNDIADADAAAAVNNHKVSDHDTATDSAFTAEEGEGKNNNNNNDNKTKEFNNELEVVISAAAATTSASSCISTGGIINSINKPGKLKVPPAFLGGAAGGSTASSRPTTTTTTASSSTKRSAIAGTVDTSSDANVAAATAEEKKPTSKLREQVDTTTATTSTAHHNKSKVTSSSSKHQPITAAAQGGLHSPARSLAHAEERKRLMEKRRKMKHRMKANQLQHQQQGGGHKQEVAEIVSPADGNGGGIAGTSASSPASECSIECVLKPSVAGATTNDTKNVSASTTTIPSSDAAAAADAAATVATVTGKASHQKKKASLNPAPPLPTKPLGLRRDVNLASLPPIATLDKASTPYDEAILPASPPRVTRSPLSGIMRPTIDDADTSMLPSLELSPIRRTASASSDASNERAAPQSVAGTVNPQDTPIKRQAIPPPSRDSTPKTANKGIPALSADALLSHPSLVPKDLPTGKPRNKPAGLPLSPHKASSGPGKLSIATAPPTAATFGGDGGAVASSPGRPPKSPASSPMRANAVPKTTPEAAAPKRQSTVSSLENGDVSDGENLLDVSGDSLLSWLAKSDNESVTSAEQSLFKIIQNLDPKAKRKDTPSRSVVKVRSQSLDVISESQPHQQAQQASKDAVVNTAAGTEDAGIGSFFSMISSAYNDLKIDNALEAMMEAVAEGVDLGYKEVNSLTNSFLDGPPGAGNQQQQQQRRRRRTGPPRPPSPGMGPIHVEISRSFNPTFIPSDNDENATVGSKSGVISALTYETYEDYSSTVSMSPARIAPTAGRSTPRGIVMSYSEDTRSNTNTNMQAIGGSLAESAVQSPATSAAAAAEVEVEIQQTPSFERRFFA